MAFNLLLLPGDGIGLEVMGEIENALKQKGIA